MDQLESVHNGKMIKTINKMGFMFIGESEECVDEFVRFSGTADGPVADFGCAFGHKTKLMLNAGAKCVIANDLAAEHLEFLEKSLTPDEKTRVIFIPGDAMQVCTQLDQDSLAGILAANWLHFLPPINVRKIFALFFRLLQPKGMLCVVTTSTRCGLLVREQDAIEKRRLNGDEWPGLVSNDRICGPSTGQLPGFMLFLDPEHLAREAKLAGFHVKKATFLDRSVCPVYFHVDGREGAGLIAIKPAQECSEINCKSTTEPNLPVCSEEVKKYSTMVIGDTLGFTKGSQPPPDTNETIRLYSMRFCPYAHRVRLVLNFKNLKYDVVNIDLKEKPEWYQARNPLGKVPLLEEKGQDKAIFESLIIAEYLDDKFHDYPLLPADNPFERAQQKMLIEVIISKLTAQWHPLMMKDDEEKRAILVSALEYVEGLLTTPFFAGDTIGFVDLMIWPWFERLPAVEKFRGIPFTSEKYPKLTAWAQKVRDHPQVKPSIYPTDLHYQYLQTRNFNTGL